MALQGWQFAAELSDLRTVGRVDLPAIGYTYAAMNHAVASTQDGEESAFAAPGGGTTAAHAAWASLRDDLQNFLGRTAQTMHAAGVTVEHIVDAYAATDAGAAASLHSAWDQGQTPALTQTETQYRHDVLPPVLTPAS
jgi:hypothetical protein